MAFDLLLRGGTLVDGTGAPGRPADVGVAELLDVSGLVVASGFVDPDGHSDGERTGRLLRRGQ